jgi:hypothetical protein
MLALPHDKVVAAMDKGWALLPTTVRPRNKPKAAKDWRSLAAGLQSMYGSEKYGKAAQYLEDLANERLGLTDVVPLTWHASSAQVAVPEADYVPHECVLATIAPSIPLQTVWRRKPLADQPRRGDDA